MLIHFVNNGTAVVMAHVTDLPQDTYWIELMDRTTYGLVYILSLVVVGACLLAFRRIPLEQSRGNIDAVELKAD